MLALSLVPLSATIAALARRPTGLAAVGVGALGVAVELAAGAIGAPALERVLAATLPLAAFLSAAFWLAALAEGAGLADALAAAMARTARGSGVRLYVVTCALCAVLTATISLDGAVVLVVPLVLAVAREDPALRRTLLLGTVAVANAFSLAVPQGNPTNLVVMQRLGLGPGAFVAHLIVPAIVATLVCVVVPAVLGRGALRRARIVTPPSVRSPAPVRGLAVGALAAAAATGVAGPWIGVAPWWTLTMVAAGTWLAARVRGHRAPSLPVPWRIAAQVAVLVALVGTLPGVGAVSVPTSLLGVLAVALGATALAGVANNLPAGVALAGLLGTPGLGAYAALAGLSVGALATPHGSVATLVAFERGGVPRRSPATILPTALAATMAAAAAVWLVR